MIGETDGAAFLESGVAGSRVTVPPEGAIGRAPGRRGVARGRRHREGAREEEQCPGAARGCRNKNGAGKEECRL
eukprot:6188-Chlamydomonas_euryale.AAC.1